MTKYDRLSALDASFVVMESGTTPMHLGSIATFERGPFYDSDDRFRLGDIQAELSARLDMLPRFRRKLMTVPGSQGRPIWVDEADFDIARHVKVIRLPEPSDERQLFALAADLHMRLLDREHPLWELWFVEGLIGDRVAVVQKIHHALADGVSGVDVATVMLDFSADAPPAPRAAYEPVAAPTPLQLLLDTWWERAGDPAQIYRLVNAELRKPRPQRRDGTSAGPVPPEGAPPSPLNVAVGATRRFEVVRQSLAAVKGIRAQLGGTVNDVVLAAVAGGLRHLLTRRGETTDGLVLRALVPVSLRRDAEHAGLGNRVGALIAPLPVGQAGAVARLESVQAAMRGLKASGQTEAAPFLLEVANHLPPMTAVPAGRAAPNQSLINIVVTNVPGPPVPLYTMGAEMLETFPIAPLGPNLAISIGVLSYNGQLTLGLFGDAAAFPDLAALAEGIENSFAELTDTDAELEAVG